MNNKRLEIIDPILLLLAILNDFTQVHSLYYLGIYANHDCSLGAGLALHKRIRFVVSNSWLKKNLMPKLSLINQLERTAGKDILLHLDTANIESHHVKCLWYKSRIFKVLQCFVQSSHANFCLKIMIKICFKPYKALHTAYIL